MKNDSEHEELNTGRPSDLPEIVNSDFSSDLSEKAEPDHELDIPEGKSKPAPDGEESVVSDLLFALGFKRKSYYTAKQRVSQETGVEDAKVEEEKSEEKIANDVKYEQKANPTEETGDYFLSELPVESLDSSILNKSRARKKIIAVLVILLIGAGLYLFLPYLLEPTPPGATVVASYNGKNITTDELLSFISLERAKEREHAYCEVHGYDHSQCTSDEPCESHPVDSLEGYQQMATRLAIEQIIQEWAESQGITQQEDVQHGLKDLLEGASVNQLIEQLHEEEITPESIPSWEVKQYYDENIQTYTGKALSEVEDEIRQILVSKKDENFFEQYIEKLKQTAGLQVNLDLLKVSEPSDAELSAYYDKNIADYKTAEKAEALEIKITSADAQSKANEAIRKIRSGESFDNVASAYGENGKANRLSLERGADQTAIAAAIWKMKPGNISDPVANEDGSVSIIKLSGTTPAGIKPFSDVRPAIRYLLLQNNMEKEYGIRKDEALFSVHSRRYTIGDFYTEFKELPPEYQAQFSTFEQKQQLVEQLIAKELLLEETGDSSVDESQRHGFDEMKIQYLAQILHQQEVDEKLMEPTEDEAKKFYEQNKETFVIPEEAKLSFIWTDQGLNGEKADQARQKAEEALSLLNGGTDFAEVAKKYSEDGSAGSGGEIGANISLDQLPEELGKKIFSLNPGETSGVIDYDYGFYIFKLWERTEARQMTFEEVSEDVKAHLSEEKHSQLESEMEQTLLEKADFTIYNKTLRKLLKEQQAQMEQKKL